MAGEALRVVIGMDPHKRSVTIEVMTADESVLGGGRFATDAAGYSSMLERVAVWPHRVCHRGLQRHRPPHRSPAARRR